MSKIALSGNASGTGTFTIASPNSSTDRTLNLPDAAGTIQVSGNPISGTTGTFTGLVDISAAGAGQIAFPATQNASANANTLDDYEEGTWTPSLNNFTLGNGTATGFYTKVGNLVSLQFRFVLGSTSSMGNATTVSGLPITVASFATGYVDILDSGTKQFSASVATYSNGASMDVRGIRADTTYAESYVISSTTPMTWATGDSITCCMTYRAA
jgi:hypothetical protein